MKRQKAEAAGEADRREAQGRAEAEQLLRQELIDPADYQAALDHAEAVKADLTRQGEAVQSSVNVGALCSSNPQSSACCLLPAFLLPKALRIC